MAAGERTVRERHEGSRRSRLTGVSRAISGGEVPLAAFFVAAVFLLAGCRKGGPDIRIVREHVPDEPPAVTAPIPHDVSLTPAESRAVRTFLLGHRGWQLASDADAHPSEDADDLTPLYGVYHPYFLRGDLDDDGVIDFVAAFIDRGKPAASPWFTVVVFPGDGHGGYRTPEVIESEISLERGDVSIDRDSVVITPDLADDDTTRRYRWNPHRRRFEYVSGDDNSPDRAPSTRVDRRGSGLGNRERMTAARRRPTIGGRPFAMR